MDVALHPSERAARRRTRGPVRRHQWTQAARIAAPIVGVIAVVLGILFMAAPVGTRAAVLDRLVVGASRHNKAQGRTALASPGRGTTGTVSFPSAPESPHDYSRVETAAVSAAPFTLRGAAARDRSRALECLTAAIYYEAASEPDDGQRAVAQVVLNRVRHPAFPATICGVVYQGAEKASGCQFSFACDGAMARVPVRAAWARAARTAAAALAGYVFRPVGLATHYHTYAVTPAWNRGLVMTGAIGAHFFHRWKGQWGTAGAFRQHYAGNEPPPGPRTIIPEQPIIALARPVQVAPAHLQPMLHSDHEDADIAVSRQTGPASPESQILDRWKDSGKPLR